MPVVTRVESQRFVPGIPRKVGKFVTSRIRRQHIATPQASLPLNNLARLREENSTSFVVVDRNDFDLDAGEFDFFDAGEFHVRVRSRFRVEQSDVRDGPLVS
jgi:hypothetical protein